MEKPRERGRLHRGRLPDSEPGINAAPTTACGGRTGAGQVGVMEGHRPKGRGKGKIHGLEAGVTGGGKGKGGDFLSVSSLAAPVVGAYNVQSTSRP